MTASQDTCPQCGQPFAAGGVAGLCPACLLRQGAACDTGLPGSFTPPAPEELREWFPQLDILSLIGTGGMGAVYQARQRGLDRFVALKILPPGIGERPGFAERFTREAKALARLSHPGIVTIHDSGRVDGLYYLLMEYVDGLNLRQLMNRGPVSPREALAIVPAICDALQYAHDHGIVHRDIKPENILLDKHGRVKVADFGLAKLVGTDESEPAGAHPPEPLLTGTGHVMGTPQYMAPEQVTSPSEVDHRADIYSLGVVLYQMLTGELPGQALVPPSHKVTIDVRLDEVVLRALEQNPDRRYQQVSEVRNVVETIIHSSNPHPTPPTPMEIKFNCPGCGQKLSVDESAAGEEFTCPSCATPFVVPAPTASTPVMAPPPPPVPPAPAMTSPPPMRPPTNFTPLGGEPPRAKAWAIWALVLGIIGIIPILGLATGLIALALGIVALVKKTTSKGVAIAGTVLGGLGTLMIPFHLLILTTSIGGMKVGARTAVCMSNLKQIGMGIVSYQQQNGGEYPANLDALEKAGLIPAKVLQCPFQEGPAGGHGYDYSRPSGPNAQGILAWDRSPHTINGVVVGRNVLLADLSVRLMTEQEFNSTPKAGRGNSRPAAIPTAPSNSRTPQETRTQRPPTTPAAPPQPPHVEEPMTIARALDGLKTAQPREMRPLLQFLKESSVEEAQRAGVMAAIKPLLADVDSGNMAFEVFCQWAGKEEVPDFIEFIRVAPNSARSKESMKLLSRMGDERAAEPLAACLTDFFVVRDAKAALAALGDIAKPALLPYYHHESRHAREAARELLRGYKATEDELFAVTIQALQSGPAATRQSAIQELTAGSLPPGKKAAACRALRPLVSDTERAVHDGARKAMIALAGPADADFLLELMTSTDDGLRQFATDLLVKFKDARAAKPLAVLLADSHKTHAAGRSLIALGSAAEPAVIPYLRAEDPNTRKRAAEVLTEIGTSASLSALQPLTRDKNFFAKVAAERAVNAIKARVGAGRR